MQHRIWGSSLEGWHKLTQKNKKSIWHNMDLRLVKKRFDTTWIWGSFRLKSDINFTQKADLIQNGSEAPRLKSDKHLTQRTDLTQNGSEARKKPVWRKIDPRLVKNTIRNKMDLRLLASQEWHHSKNRIDAKWKRKFRGLGIYGKETWYKYMIPDTKTVQSSLGTKTKTAGYS